MRCPQVSRQVDYFLPPSSPFSPSLPFSSMGLLCLEAQLLPHNKWGKEKIAVHAGSIQKVSEKKSHPQRDELFSTDHQGGGREGSRAWKQACLAGWGQGTACWLGVVPSTVCSAQRPGRSGHRITTEGPGQGGVIQTRGIGVVEGGRGI